jgi:hypothetical protein
MFLEVLFAVEVQTSAAGGAGNVHPTKLVVRDGLRFLLWK